MTMRAELIKEFIEAGGEIEIVQTEWNGYQAIWDAERGFFEIGQRTYSDQDPQLERIEVYTPGADSVYFDYSDSGDDDCASWIASGADISKAEEFGGYTL